MNFLFEVFPNPVSDFLKIRKITDSNTTYELFLTDNYGNELTKRITTDNDTYTLNISQLNKGSYLLNVLINDRIISYNILKK